MMSFVKVASVLTVQLKKTAIHFADSRSVSPAAGRRDRFPSLDPTWMIIFKFLGCVERITRSSRVSSLIDPVCQPCLDFQSLQFLHAWLWSPRLVSGLSGVEFPIFTLALSIFLGFSLALMLVVCGSHLFCKGSSGGGGSVGARSSDFLMDLSFRRTTSDQLELMLSQ